MYTLSYMQNNANAPMNPQQNAGGGGRMPNAMNSRGAFATPAYRTGQSNAVPSIPTYDAGQSNAVPSIPTYDAGQSNAVPSIPAYDAGQSDAVPAIPAYDGDSSNVVPAIPAYDGDSSNVVPAIPAYDGGPSNVVPAIPTYDGGSSNVVPAIPTYDGGPSNVVPAIPAYDGGSSNVVPAIPTYDGGKSKVVPAIPAYDAGKSNKVPAIPTYDADGSRNSKGTAGSIVTVFPKGIIPCYFCNTTQNGSIRFLNAAAGYNPFIIYINDQMVINGLDNAEVSQYSRVSSGSQTITVAGQNGYVYIQKQITVPLNTAITVAIINADNGLDLLVITDEACNGGANLGCFRACNLSQTNQNIKVTLNGGAVTFQNVKYREVTSFRYLQTGYYTVSVSNSLLPTGNLLLTSNIYIRGNVSYTLYVFNWNNAKDAIRILIVEDSKN